jgi:Cys-tRNA(Pro) deacylase
MSKSKAPVTQAVRVLRRAKVAFDDHLYTYIEGGGTAQFAREKSVDEYLTIKTLIMEDDGHNPLIVLMHGDQQVSTKTLARHLGVKHVHPCDPKVANKHSGYQVGGTSPFGTRRKMPVYCQASIADLPKIYINGGSRGYIISMHTIDMLNLLTPTLVDFPQRTGNDSANTETIEIG